MNKLVKFLLIVVAGLVIFSAALVFILFTVINPNRYRGVLENLVAQQSGLQLTIAGDMSWQFRPVFGIGIEDVRLSNPDSPQELASFSRISLRLAPAALLRGELDMEELLAENLHVNWIVNSQGESNWPERQRSTQATSTSTSPNDIPVSVNIQQITVRNAGFMIQDQQRGINAAIQNINISSRNTNLDNQPFPLSIDMSLRDALSGRELPVALETTAQIDMNAGNLQLHNMQLSLSPLQLSGNVSINDFLNELTWQAELSSNTFPLPHLLANLAADDGDLPPPDQQRISVSQLNAHGDFQSIRINPLVATLGDGSNADRIEMTADATLATDTHPVRVNYELRSAHIDVDAWLPASAETEPSAGTSATGAWAESELPLDLITGTNVRGTHSIADLRFAGLQFTPANFGLVIENGELALDTQSIGFYGGEIDLLARLNARATPAQLILHSELHNINAATLSPEMPILSFLNGRFDVVTDHRMAGNTVSALLDSITGSSQMQISESTMNITLLKQIFSAISVLNPAGDLASSWPDVLPINNTQAALNFNNGLQSQELSVRLDNFDIAGTGGIDLNAGRFDYQMAFTILGDPAPQSIAINPDFQNIAWPIRCNAAFSDSPARYCSPDMQRVREVFAQIARGEIERRAGGVINEQIENVRNRLRNLFQ